jgi:hypothetical protein
MTTPVTTTTATTTRNEQPVETKPSKKPTRRQSKRTQNKDRHKRFVKWLVTTFPTAIAQSSTTTTSTTTTSSHILDVAGGKGECAVRLAMCHQVKVVLIDPRPANLEDCFVKEVLFKLPKKWQTSILEKQAKNPNFVKDTIDTQCQQLVTSFTTLDLLESSSSSSGSSGSKLLLLQHVVQEASLLVGLHADGATEAIVDAALQYHKPFVVVPCCVFPNLFSDRRIRSAAGSMIPVRSHEQFCLYLLQKHPDFQMETLPFDGRNVAIFWNPTTNDDAESSKKEPIICSET